METSNKLNDDRRIRIFIVDQTDVIGIFDRDRAMGSRYVEFAIDDNGGRLPVGVVVLSVSYMFDRHAFAFIVRHPSFAVVPIGDKIPIHNHPCQMKLVEISRTERETWLEAQLESAKLRLAEAKAENRGLIDLVERMRGFLLQDDGVNCIRDMPQLLKLLKESAIKGEEFPNE